MTLTIHLFARGRDLAGADAIAVEVPAGATVARLRQTLADQYPALGPLLEVSAIAVNHDFAEDSRNLAESDEIAVIPPVSGGSQLLD
jgi:molybdopterin converting factor subunit 1